MIKGVTQKKHNKQVQRITKEVKIGIFFILYRYER